MEINLLPWRDEILVLNKKIFLRMLLVAVLSSCLALVAMYHLFFGQLIYTKSYTAALEEAKVGFVDSIKTHMEYKKTHEEMLRRIDTLRRLEQSRFDAVRLLNALAQTTPKGMYITKVTRNNNEIELTGYANSNLLISSFMKEVDRSADFDVLSLKHAQTAGAGGAAGSEGPIEFGLYIKLTLRNN